MDRIVTRGELSEAAGPLRGLLAGLDPDTVPAGEVPGVWEELEALVRQATGVQTLLARRVDESDAPAKAGLRNGAEWIAARSGTYVGSAYETVKASKRLAGMPDVADAVRRGDLSAGQVSKVAAAAEVAPGEAQRLVNLAGRVSLRELHDECLRVRAKADPDPDRTQDRIRRERRLRWFTDTEGAWCLSGRGPIEAGAEFSVVLASIVDEIFVEARESGDYETRDAYSFDAALEMARRAWAYMHGIHLDDIDDVVDGATEADAGQGDTDRDVAEYVDAVAPDIVGEADHSDGEAIVEPAGQDFDEATSTAATAPAGDDGGRVGNCTGEAGAVLEDDTKLSVIDRLQELCQTAGLLDASGRDAEPVEDPEIRNDPDPGPTAGSGVQAPRKRQRGPGVNQRFRGLIRVDHSALVRGWVEDDEICEITGVGPVPVRVARQLLGDAILHLVLTKGKDVANTVYLGRGPNMAQKVALWWAQPECSREGCPRLVAEWDHRDPYAHNPVTHIGNLDGFCEPDHDLKTNHGWALVEGTGKRPMVPPDDPQHPNNTRRRRPGRIA